MELIDQLVTTIAQAGVRADRIDVANFYVVLKHRPMVILTGAVGSGKAALLSCLANFLVSNSSLPRQIVSGHAWYAGGSRGSASTVLIDMHTRMITEKLLFVLEEALQPENTQQVFIVGLTHISPAELNSFFTEVAFQLQHNELLRLGDTHLSSPIPFPPNLLLIGTMDTTKFDWWDEDLLSGATVIEWLADAVVPQAGIEGNLQNFGGVFMRSSVRSSRKAYGKLLSVMADTRQPLQAIMLFRNIIQAYGFEFSPALFDEVILYLANAWSQQGNGLFNPSPSDNLAIASDLALAQLVLPQHLKLLRSSVSLQEKLYAVLDERLPRSRNFLERHCGKYPTLVH